MEDFIAFINRNKNNPKFTFRHFEFHRWGVLDGQEGYNQGDQLTRKNFDETIDLFLEQRLSAYARGGGGYSEQEVYRLEYDEYATNKGLFSTGQQIVYEKYLAYFKAKLDVKVTPERKAVQLKLPEIALRAYYQGDHIDKDNAADYLDGTTHKSTKKLIQWYGFFLVKSHRVGVDDNKTIDIANNLKKRLEKALTYVDENYHEKIKFDIEKLAFNINAKFPPS